VRWHGQRNDRSTQRCGGTGVDPAILRSGILPAMPADNVEYSRDGRWSIRHWSTDAGTNLQLEHLPTGEILLDLTSDVVDVETWNFSKDQALLHLRVARRDRQITSTPITLDLTTGLYYHHPDPRQAHGPVGDAEDLRLSLEEAKPPRGHDWATFRPRWVARELLDHPKVPDVTSPDGKFLIDLNTNAIRMAEVLHPVKIIEVASKAVLLDLWGTMYDTRAVFESGTGRLLLKLTKYPEVAPSLRLAIDLEREVYWDTAGTTVSDPPRGYLDELQHRLGLGIAELGPRDWSPSVRRSKRPGDPKPKEAVMARPRLWSNEDGHWALRIDPFEVGPRDVRQQAVIEHIPSAELALDLRGSPWECAGEFMRGCNQLFLSVSEKGGKRTLRVKIDLDCKLYWEESGTMVGEAGGGAGGVQAGFLQELQARLGATASEQARLGLKIETKAAANPEIAPGVVAQVIAARAMVGSAPIRTGAVAELLERAEGLGLAREVLMALRVAREVSEGSLTAEQGAGELGRWMGTR